MLIFCGTMRVLSHSGNRYFMTTTVSEQRYTRVKLLKNRENAEGYFHDYTDRIGRHTKVKVGRVHTDYDKEFLSIKKGLEK